MALLESGVDLAVIALWLGHVSIEIELFIYTRISQMKEKTLGTIAAPTAEFRRFRADDRLMSFLDSL